MDKNREMSLTFLVSHVEGTEKKMPIPIHGMVRVHGHPTSKRHYMQIENGMCFSCRFFRSNKSCLLSKEVPFVTHCALG